MNDAKALLSLSLEQQGEQADILYWLALLHHQQGETEKAVSFMRKCHEMESEQTPALQALCSMQMALSRFEGALTDAKKLTEMAPKQAMNWYLLALAESALKQFKNAIDSLNKALKIEPGLTQAIHEKAICHHQIYEYEMAVSLYEKIQTVERENPWFHYNYGLSLQAIGQEDHAINCMREAADIRPDFLDAWFRMGDLQARMADWSGLNESQNKIASLVKQGVKTAQTSPYLAETLGLSSKVQKLLACEYSQKLKQSCNSNPEMTHLPIPGLRKERLQLIYYSGDLNLSAVGMLMAGVVAQHDRNEWQITAATTRKTGDKLECWYQQNFDQWIDLSETALDESERLLKTQNADALIDLSGYTRFGRSEVLCRSVAPLQIALLGYLNTYCADFMNGIVLDDWIRAKGCEHFDEAIYSHPFTVLPPFLDHEILDLPLPVAARKSSDKISLGSFNASYKINQDVLNTWVAIMNQLPNADFYLSGNGPEVAWQRLKQRFVEAGVDPARVHINKAVDLSDFIRRLQNIDLVLDSFPYNGGATTVCALSAGTPVFTLAGSGALARMSSSLCRALEMPDCIAANPGDYINGVVKLIGLGRHKKYREQLHQQLDNRSEYLQSWTRGLETVLTNSLRR